MVNRDRSRGPDNKGRLGAVSRSSTTATDGRPGQGRTIVRDPVREGRGHRASPGMTGGGSRATNSVQTISITTIQGERRRQCFARRSSHGMAKSRDCRGCSIRRHGGRWLADGAGGPLWTRKQREAKVAVRVANGKKTGGHHRQPYEGARVDRQARDRFRRRAFSTGIVTPRDRKLKFVLPYSNSRR